jgi:hypothetical protein
VRWHEREEGHRGQRRHTGRAQENGLQVAKGRGRRAQEASVEATG